MSELPHNGYGAVLRQRREELGLSLNDMATSTRIHKTYLQALEEENLRILPGTVYAVGFLRIYARELGLPVAPLLAALTGNAAPAADAGHSAAGGALPRRTINRSGKRRSGRWLAWLCLLALVTAGYFYWQAGGLPAPPMLVAPAPPDQSVPPAPSTPPHSALPPLATAPVLEQPAPAAGVFSVVPAEGAVVRVLPVAQGTLKVSLDQQELREYQLQPDQSLNWKVSVSLACELSAPGLVRVWVGQDELAVGDLLLFTLNRSGAPEDRP